MTDMKDMGAALPQWLSAVAWLWIAAGLLGAAAILFDIVGRGRRQRDPFMNAIWPLAALYLGPLALPAYLRFGRPAGQQNDRHSGSRGPDGAVVGAVIPGGVASGLAHLIAVPFVVATGLTIAGLDMWAMVAIIAVLATAMIFVFDYAQAARRGHKLSAGGALVAAVLTVVAFDVGMLGWMLVLHYTGTMPAASDVRFTLLMQIGLILGTLTALPFIRVLLSRRAPIAPAL